jgi:hypothetical protein
MVRRYALKQAPDIWSAATGVAAFQHALIRQRIGNSRRLCDPSRFEKRRFRPPQSKSSRGAMLYGSRLNRRERREGCVPPSADSTPGAVRVMPRDALCRGATADGSRGLQPTDKEGDPLLSRSDNRMPMVPACNCRSATNFVSSRNPWAEAHGYLRMPLCGNERSQFSNRWTAEADPTRLPTEATIR